MGQQLRSSLREQQHSTIRKLANTIESIWHSELVLSDYATPSDLGYVEGSLEGERLTIQNYCHQTTQFRKLHLELAQVGKSLDILHCVMFPRPNYHLPILGIDIVAGRGKISAAIVDLSPVMQDRSLPPKYEEQLSQLPSVSFSQPRELPAWGQIFSKFCLFVRPVTPEEEDAFLDQVAQYLSIHCQLASEALPVSSLEEEAIITGQRYYCSQQQKNDKTRRVLENAFGKEWADCYVRTMLFDVM
ncbi:MAG: phycocyanobilin:ferredoxin oxidoreductase [Phormidesmis priestleyi Ana]|uniref:Phycocyanobilin:ferredoxin oxidoreductase n=1 Tax=Phormidesmis priestleyi Ana TaxID=1666911 RepID=A0A0N8KNX8_9CYAN|nr:MAG: phycocyanobilin:ferredoxin oxidoreductase [Phormidesmis priestleyi Ana]